MLIVNNGIYVIILLYMYVHCKYSTGILSKFYVYQKL